MHTSDDVRGLILRVLAEECDNHTVDTIQDDLLLREDLELDSLNLVQVVVDIENELKVDLSDDDIESMKTVGDAIRLVSQRL